MFLSVGPPNGSAVNTTGRFSARTSSKRSFWNPVSEMDEFASGEIHFIGARMAFQHHSKLKKGRLSANNRRLSRV